MADPKLLKQYAAKRGLLAKDDPDYIELAPEEGDSKFKIIPLETIPAFAEGHRPGWYLGTGPNIYVNPDPTKPHPMMDPEWKTRHDPGMYTAEDAATTRADARRGWSGLPESPGGEVVKDDKGNPVFNEEQKQYMKDYPRAMKQQGIVNTEMSGPTGSAEVADREYVNNPYAKKFEPTGSGDAPVEKPKAKKSSEGESIEKDPETLYNKGMRAFKAGDFLSAAQAFNHANAANYQPATQVAEGLALERAKQDGASELYQNALANYFMNLGSDQHAELAPETIQHMREALHLDPKFAKEQTLIDQKVHDLAQAMLAKGVPAETAVDSAAKIVYTKFYMEK